MTMCFSISLPPRIEALPVLQGGVRELAAMAGFDALRTNDIQLACEETFVEIAGRAAEDSAEPVRLDAELTRLALTLVFTDREMPPAPDDSLDPCLPEENAADALLAGLGRKLICASSDEAFFEPYGKAGNRLRLLFKRLVPDIISLASTDELQAFDTQTTPSPAQELHIRLAGEEKDWFQISRLIFRAYGYTHPSDDIYYPDRMRELNQTGRLVSVVAASATGELVGHYALELGGLGQIASDHCTVAETGMAVVHPGHRNRGLMELMRTRLEQEARTRGLHGLFSQPVTKHSISQQVNEKFGSHACALSLAFLGDSFKFRSRHGEQENQRESCLLYYKPLCEPQNRPICPPAHHREMLLESYRECGIPVTLAENLPSHEGPSIVSTHFLAALELGLIRIETVGADIAAAVRAARNRLCRKDGAKVLYLSMRLAHAGCSEACAAAEQIGFFYGGLAPHFDDGEDMLRMQYLDTDLDITRLQIASPFARRLTAYVEADRQRVENR